MDFFLRKVYSSRLISNHKPENEDIVIASISFEEDVSSTPANIRQLLPVTAGGFANHTLHDCILSNKLY